MYEVTAKAYSPVSVAFVHPSLSCAHAAQVGVAKAIAAAIIRVESQLCIFAPSFRVERRHRALLQRNWAMSPRVERRLAAILAEVAGTVGLWAKNDAGTVI